MARDDAAGPCKEARRARILETVAPRAGCGIVCRHERTVGWPRSSRGSQGAAVRSPRNCPGSGRLRTLKGSGDGHAHLLQARDDALPANDLGIEDSPFRDGLRVFDEVGRVVEAVSEDHLAVAGGGGGGGAPGVLLVGVSRVRSFDVLPRRLGAEEGRAIVGRDTSWWSGPSSFPQTMCMHIARDGCPRGPGRVPRCVLPHSP